MKCFYISLLKLCFSKLHFKTLKEMTLFRVSGNGFVVFFCSLYSSQRILLQTEQLGKNRNLKLPWSLISGSKLFSVK